MMIISGRIKPARIPVVYFIIIAILLSTPLTTHAYQQKLVPNPYYLDGIKCSREEVRDHGEMLTGFAFGLSLPFLTYLTTEVAYKNIHRSNECGAVGGVIGLSFWLWSGNTLIKNKTIAIPEYHLINLEDNHKEDFKKGYRQGVHKFRKTQYIKGVTVGLGTVIIIPIMIFAYALSTLKY